MDITIQEIHKIDVPSDPPGYVRVYVKVSAVEGDKVIACEEFHIGRQVNGRRIVTNANGWYKLAGRGRAQYVDPATLNPDEPMPEFEYESFTLDLRAEVLDVVRRTIRGKLDDGRLGDNREILRTSVKMGDDSTLPLDTRQLSTQVVQ